MFCLLIDSQSRLTTTIVIILYTCVLIPFRQLKHSLLDIIDVVFSRNKGPAFHEGSCFVDLPVSRYDDVECRSRSADDEEGEEVCCVCLTEFEKEDVVSQLPKCGHVFHMGCIEGWLNRNRFSCPLCRSLLLSVTTSPCKSSH